jgi:hypothetical protein
MSHIIIEDVSKLLVSGVRLQHFSYIVIQIIELSALANKALALRVEIGEVGFEIPAQVVMMTG